MKSVSIRTRRSSKRGRPFQPGRRAARETKVGHWSSTDAVYFDLLKEFVRRERHARVPEDHREGNFGLGRWVGRKRHAFRHGGLSGEQIRKFEELAGWSWSPKDELFPRGLQALENYLEREGHCLVPREHTEAGFRLGLWVANRRADYRKGRLTLDQIWVLESHRGWIWDSRRDSFAEAFRYLQRFVRWEGHARVPVEHVERGFSLGAWVHKCRAQRDRISKARRRRLEALPGWSWNVFESQWQEGLRFLRAYRKREGHALVPAHHVEAGFRLGRWVSHLRGRKQTLSPARRMQLEAIPGWKWRVRPARKRR